MKCFTTSLIGVTFIFIPVLEKNRDLERRNFPKVMKQALSPDHASSVVKEQPPKRPPPHQEVSEKCSAWYKAFIKSICKE